MIYSAQFIGKGGSEDESVRKLEQGRLHVLSNAELPGRETRRSARQLLCVPPKERMWLKPAFPRVVLSGSNENRLPVFYLPENKK